MRRKIGTGWMLSGALLLSVSMLACGGDSVDKCKDLPASCPTPDEQMCGGNTIQVCKVDANQCLVWTDTSTCGTRQKCVSQGNVASCQCNNQSGCDSVGKTKCSTNKITTCKADSNSCRYWEEGIDCAATNQFCDGSSGVAKCSDTCQSDCTTEGANRCSQTGEVIQTCTKVGECLNWTDGTDCATQNPAKKCDATGGTAQCTSLCIHECATAGLTRCSQTGEIIQTCTTDNNGCRKWVDGLDCDATGRNCDAAGGVAQCLCIDTCATSGQTQCSSVGEVIETCETDAQGCKHWTTGTDCAASNGTCEISNNTAQCQCNNQCDTSGKEQCNGQVIQTCTSDANGCRSWVDGTDCSQDVNNPNCFDNNGDASCVPTCSPDCNNAGDTECQVQVIRTCTSLNGCLKWVTGTDCAATDQLCDTTGGTAHCVCANDCSSGQTQCSDVGEVIETCAQDANNCYHWASGTNCAANSQECKVLQGTAQCVAPCNDQCATPGVDHCDGTLIQTCTLNQSNGCNEWVDGTNCQDTNQFCDASTQPAQCIDHCSNGCSILNATGCNGNSIMICQAGQGGCNVWAEQVDCSVNNQYCDDSSGTAQCMDNCISECASAGLTQCNGDIVEICTLVGANCNRWVAGENCSSSGKYCDDSLQPAVCADSCADECNVPSTMCNGSVIETCINIAPNCDHWVPGVNCAGLGQICDDTSGDAQCLEQCQNDCATGNETRCFHSNIVETCTPDSQGCLKWVTTQTCADNEICVVDPEAHCALNCANACQIPDSQCNPADKAIIQACTLDQTSGCTIWIDDTNCSQLNPPRVCDDTTEPATCVLGCTNECAEGLIRCSSTPQVLETCQLSSVTGCTVWVAGVNCADTNQFCYESAGSASCVDNCTSDCTTAGETRCLNDDSIQTCTLTYGQCLIWTITQDCNQSGQFCDRASQPAICYSPSCTDLQSIEGYGVATGNNSNETDKFVPNCGYGVQGRDVCFTWTAPTEGLYQFDTQGSTYDTTLAIYLNGQEIACNDDIDVSSGNYQSSVSVNLQANDHAVIVLDAYSTATGDYVLSINAGVGETDCANWLDDDGDQTWDCADPSDCQSMAECEPGSGAVGTPCIAPTACAANDGDPACLDEANWTGMTGGYCSEWCNLQFDDCAFGSHCVDFGVPQGLCMADCDPANGNADCRAADGYICCASSRTCQPSGWTCSTCGNGQLDQGEECDGQNLNDQTCQTMGYQGGVLACGNNCMFDYTHCTGTQMEVQCSNWTDDDGDGLYDCGDPTNCQALGACAPGNGAVGTACTANTNCAANGNDPACLDEAYWDTLGGYCSEWCNLQADDCASGSHCVNFGVSLGMCMADCDPANGDADCRTAEGYICCASSRTCQPSAWYCNPCGNGQIDLGEQCDSQNLNNESCQSQGYPGGGSLGCDGNCQFDLTQCTMGSCQAVQLGVYQNPINMDLDSCTGTQAYNAAGWTSSNPSASCTGYTSLGRELVFQIIVPPGRTLQVQMVNPEFDASLWVTPDCMDYTGVQCAVGADEGIEGDTETLLLTNNGTANAIYYIIADTWSNSIPSCGAFMLSILDTSAEMACTDFVDNDNDGFMDCGDPSNCQFMAECVPGSSAVGSACTANTDCAANNGMPLCITEATWGFTGGYCSQWCVGGDCPADSSCWGVFGGYLGSCLDDCDLANGNADCRSGYMCLDPGNGTGVCWPN